jgi:hypothetical protein
MRREEAFARRTVAQISRGPSWSVTFAGRRVTARRRPLPGLLVIGAVKAGTTTMHHALGRHPRLRGPAIKEIHFFDRPQNWAAGPGWYRAHWPSRPPGADWIAFESTPFYLPVPSVPERIRAVVPDAVLVALLRNPTDRAISHHAHQVRLGHESLPLADALDAEDRRLSAVTGATRALTHFGYRTQGQYAEQLERVFACFPRDQVVVVLSEHMFHAPGLEVQRVLDRLTLSTAVPAEGLRLNVGAPPEADEAVRRSLDRHFAPWNAELERLLGQSTGWPVT